MGVYGEILYPLSDLNESSHQSCLKPSNDRGEFELDQAKSKNNIAKNSLALEHETHNTYFFSIRPISLPMSMFDHFLESSH